MRLSAFLPFLLPVLAQVDLTLSLVRAELTLLPGEAFALALTLRNGLDREEGLSVRLTPFRLGQDGRPVETPLGGEVCARLRVTPSALTLPPRGSAEVRVEGVAPPGEGTLACMVIFGASPRPGTLGGVQLSLRPEIGFALYVTLKGTEKPLLRARVGGEGKELPILLENPGNVLQRLSGEASVLDREGRPLLVLPLAELPLLPGGVREVRLAPEASLPPGRYRVVLLLESAYGRYAAEGVWVVP